MSSRSEAVDAQLRSTELCELDPGQPDNKAASINPLSIERYRLKLCCFSYPLILVLLVFISFRQLCRFSDASLRSTSNTAHLSTPGSETQSHGVPSETSSAAKAIKVSLRESCMHGVCDDRDEEKGQRDSSPHHCQFWSCSPGTTVPPVANCG